MKKLTRTFLYKNVFILITNQMTTKVFSESPPVNVGEEMSFLGFLIIVRNTYILKEGFVRR